MDQDTIDEIKRHFGVVSEQLRSDVQRDFGVVSEQLRSDVQRDFGIVGEQLRSDVQRDFGIVSEQLRSDVKRHFGVVSEQLRSDVRAVAEALDGFRADVDRRFEEVGHEFEETRALIRLSYTELDRRVRTIETEVVDLRARLERVEGRLGG